MKVKNDAKDLLLALDILHADTQCTGDIENEYCYKCIHLKPTLVAYINSIPRWQLRVVAVVMITKSLYTIAIYPFRRVELWLIQHSRGH